MAVPPPYYPRSQEMTITKIDIPFWSIVGFMIKWAIASIPAMLVLSLGMALVGGLISACMWAVLAAAGIALPDLSGF